MTEYWVYFVSGSSSSTPITDATEGYIASSEVLVNGISSATWSNLDNKKTYRWHSYLYEKESDTWSSKSDITSFSVLDINKIIMFYRYGDNDAGNNYVYKICSGNNVDDKIQLVSGLSDGIDKVTYSPNYHYSWTNPKDGKIWFMCTWKCDKPSNDRWGSESALYTYPASLQSWKGGMDLWWYPNGTLAGSGSSSYPVRKNKEEIGYLQMSSNRAGPYCSGTLLSGAIFNASYAFMMTNANNELNYIGRDKDQLTFHSYFWYMSSNGNWYNSFTCPSSTKATAPYNSICLCPTSSNVVIVRASSNGLYAYISTDYGRTFGEQQEVLSQLSDPDWYRYPRPIIPKGYYPDEYARIFCMKSTHVSKPYSGQHMFVKFNTDGGIVSDVTTVYPKQSGSLVVYMIAPGNYRNGVNVWASVVNDSPDDTERGDPRWVMWYDENTGNSGAKRWSGASHSDQNHNSACARFDVEGNVWVAGAAYFAGFPPYIASSNMVSGTYSTKYNRVDTKAGACGCSFEVFN